ncbi:MAG: amidohydrolase [Veillonella sp.]|uniref:amidohydrolase n=1 Tax=Veillonella sp. TaxID=1926307 RepID=UPI0025E88B43|nr:amidohydrolase [Veillonella sp.]MBE6079283.1 amidohydrolase [Veillonella sp.]
MSGLTKTEVKERVCAAIEKAMPRLMEIAETIMAAPELGYKENKTTAFVQQLFTELNIPFTTGHALTGVKGRLKGKSDAYRVAMIGELDAIICPKHPRADEVTGAAHCCGHNVQIANMLAVAIGLQAEGVLPELNGEVVIFAVPAEEYVEIDYRNKLREEGKIKYLGGKQQLIYEGAFDDIDMAMQMHVETAHTEGGEMGLGATSNGFIGKLINYHGKAAHAAGAPHEGVNALQAAMMGVMGVNAIRDTFKESDYVRFHPIINSGGSLVNVVPDFVAMESYVRAANVDAMIAANKRVNRALKAGADAVGATCEINDLPGYLPMRNDAIMNEFLKENSIPLFGEANVIQGEHMAGSTDMGDVAHIIPVIHPWVGCIEGVLHGANYKISIPEVAYTKTAQALAMTIVDLLYGDGEGAKKVQDNYKPVFTKEEYIKLMDSISEGEK